MPTLRYIGPIDEVDVVGVGTVKHGDELEVTAEQAKSLLAQSDNFAAKKAPRPRKPRAAKTASAQPVADDTAEKG